LHDIHVIAQKDYGIRLIIIILLRVHIIEEATRYDKKRKSDELAGTLVAKTSHDIDRKVHSIESV